MPEIVVLTYSVIYVFDQCFAVAHVVVGMLVGGRQGSPGGVVGRIVLWLDEAVGRNIVWVAVANGSKVGVRVVEEVLVCHEAAEGERPGPVGPIDAGRDTLVGEFLVYGVEAAVEVGRHVETTTGGAAMDIKAVGEGGPRNGGEPVIADGILPGKGGENGKPGRLKTLHDIGAEGGAAALGFIIADEAGHVGHLAGCGIRDTVELLSDIGEVMVWIGGEIAGGPGVGRCVDFVLERIFVKWQAPPGLNLRCCSPAPS